jgi:hypothetical protein
VLVGRLRHGGGVSLPVAAGGSSVRIDGEVAWVGFSMRETIETTSLFSIRESFTYSRTKLTHASTHAKAIGLTRPTKPQRHKPIPAQL